MAICLIATEFFFMIKMIRLRASNVYIHIEKEKERDTKAKAKKIEHTGVGITVVTVAGNSSSINDGCKVARLRRRYAYTFINYPSSVPDDSCDYRA